jgi:hypothetical protein
MRFVGLCCSFIVQNTTRIYVFELSVYVFDTGAYVPDISVYVLHISVHVGQSLPRGLFPTVFSPKPFLHFCPSQCMPHVHPNSTHLI